MKHEIMSRKFVVDSCENEPIIVEQKKAIKSLLKLSGKYLKLGELIEQIWLEVRRIKILFDVIKFYPIVLTHFA